MVQEIAQFLPELWTDDSNESIGLIKMWVNFFPVGKQKKIQLHSP